MPFEIKTEIFSGPLHLLLELIEAKRMDITRVSLSRVTDEYLKYVDSREISPVELADFLVVAAKLLYLKSCALLPVKPEEEESAEALAAQLKLYREFVAATEHLSARLQKGGLSYARARTIALPAPAFMPPPGVDTHSLRLAFEGLRQRLAPFFALRQSSMQKVVSVEQRIKQIKEAVLKRAQISFGQLTRGAKSKVDVVVSFLALLELMKRKVIAAAQSSAFGEINLKRVK